jgi:hypothetical protein
LDAESGDRAVKLQLVTTAVLSPTIERLWQDLRAVLKKCRPDWDINRPELKAAWERGEHDRFYPYGKTYGQVFREQEQRDSPPLVVREPFQSLCSSCVPQVLNNDR